MNKILRNNFQILFILFFGLICYYFLWLNPFSMKWDLAEQYLPWRHFLGRSLQNGNIPYWNPFQLGGYPSYADPQSGFWYYPAWAIGMLFGYTMRTIELEVLSLILLSGIGFYKLLLRLELQKNTALLFSLSYMCSGFIVGNAQHLTWISAAAWLPWLFYHYLYIRKDIKNLNTIWFLIVLYLFISSSYPAFAIVSAYLMFIDQVVLFFSSKQKLNFFLQKIFLLFSIIVILFPILYSLDTSIDYFSRGDSLSLKKVLQHPFSWQSLLSLIAPFASFKNPDLFKTDISMSNAYIGIFPVIIILLSLINGSIKKNLSWLIASIVFLLIGFGDQTPLRTLLYEYLPGFNLFRFPALFRLFFIISILIYSAKQFESINFYSKKTTYLLISILSIFLISIIWNLNSWHPFQITSLSKLYKEFETTTFIQHIIYQFALLSITIALFIWIVLKKKSILYIIIITCIELIVSVRLNAMATMVLETHTVEVDKLIPDSSNPYGIPNNSSLIKNIDQNYEYRWPLNWNMNCYYGQIAIDGYNPFVLKTFNSLSDSKLKDSIWNNGWYYLVDSIIQCDTPYSINGSSSDADISNIIFNPTEFKFEIDSKEGSNIVFAQNPYPGWKSFIDEHQTDITTINFAHQLIQVPQGKHTVKWVFEDKTLRFILLTHFIIFSILLLFVSIKNISNLHL